MFCAFTLLSGIRTKNLCQKLITSSLYHCQDIVKVSSKSVEKYLSSPANRQTNQPTNATENILPSSAEGENKIQQYVEIRINKDNQTFYLIACIDDRIITKSKTA